MKLRHLLQGLGRNYLWWCLVASLLASCTVSIPPVEQFAQVAPSVQTDAWVAPEDTVAPDSAAEDMTGPDAAVDPCSPSCDDGNPCTEDSCDPQAGCVHAPNNAECDDANPCTGPDGCSEGGCAGPNIVCDDGNPCTVDSCAGSDGCVAAADANGGACSDDNACTKNDSCSAGVCKGQGVTCDDGNPCTDDSCAPKTGCDFMPTSKPCSDGDACTSTDSCVGGTCASGVKTTCDDKNPCTTDSCNPSSGCVNAANQLPCDDGNACSTGDVCTAGKCVGIKGPCPCGTNADCAAFDNGNLCDGVLTCQNKQCVTAPGSVVVCNTAADTACAKSQCAPQTGACQLTNLLDGTSCDDGNACTTKDACAAGTCAGNAITCNDGNSCTNDSCDPKLGCQYVTDPVACCKQTVCGNACVDVQTSSTNCGTCGHDCLGGACVAGLCEPKAILTLTTPIKRIALGTKHIYYTTAKDDGIYRVPKDGSAPPAMFTPLAYTVEQLAVYAGNLYWSSSDSLYLLAESKPGGTGTKILSKVLQWGFYANKLYWLQANTATCSCSSGTSSPPFYMDCDPYSPTVEKYCKSSCSCNSIPNGAVMTGALNGTAASVVVGGLQGSLYSAYKVRFALTKGSPSAVLLLEHYPCKDSCYKAPPYYWKVRQLVNGKLDELASGAMSSQDPYSPLVSDKTSIYFAGSGVNEKPGLSRVIQDSINQSQLLPCFVDTLVDAGDAVLAVATAVPNTPVSPGWFIEIPPNPVAPQIKLIAKNVNSLSDIAVDGPVIYGVNGGDGKLWRQAR